MIYIYLSWVFYNTIFYNESISFPQKTNVCKYKECVYSRVQVVNVCIQCILHTYHQ